MPTTRRSLPQDRHLAVEYLPLNALTLDPKNARLHKPAQVRQIARSIEAFAFNAPVLVDRDSKILAGHGRVMACRHLGWDEVPVIRLEHLTPEQARAFAIADNRLTETSSWDEAILAEHFKVLAAIDLDFDLEATGFTMGEIDLRVLGLDNVAEEEPEELLPLIGPLITRSGDLWQLGRHKLLCADALSPESYQRLLGSERAAMVFTDPPYNVPIPLFGNLFHVPSSTGTIYNTGFEVSNSPPGGYVAAESTFTEEFRMNGTLGDGKFTWQTGAYLEIASPIANTIGSASPGFAACLNNTFHNLQCSDPIGALFGASIGNVNLTYGQTTFHDEGLYAQGTYKLAEKLKLTGGFRYTWDSETVNTVQEDIALQQPPNYGPVANYTCLQSFITNPPNCSARFHTESNKPTWLIDLDYSPTRDMLVYGKWSRGYRQAVVVTNIPVGGSAADPDYSLNYLKPEKVDTFEVGTKTSWRGAVNGSFNVAGFYNKFTNQQIQEGFLPKPGVLAPVTSAPVNAGKSTIYGAEVEATLSPLHGLDFTLGYTYLHTRIDAVLPAPQNALYVTQPSFAVGDPLALSPRNKFTVGATYTLPTDVSFGKFSIGGSVTYRDGMLANYTDMNTGPILSQYAYLPSLTLVDANVNWNNVLSQPIDLAFFITNLTNKHYYNFFSGLSGVGFEDAVVGAPRMFGGTVKYHF